MQLQFKKNNLYLLTFTVFKLFGQIFEQCVPQKNFQVHKKQLKLTHKILRAPYGPKATGNHDDIKC